MDGMIAQGLFEQFLCEGVQIETPVCPDVAAVGDEVLVVEALLGELRMHLLSTDFLIQANRDFMKKLDENKYPYTFMETDGGHIWRNWRIYLSEFVPLIFK